MRKSIIIAGAFLAMHVAPLYAAEPPSVHFSHVDWEMACDNTRTCRAAGYQSEVDEGLPVSIKLVRKVGPHQAVTAELELIPKDDKPTSESVRAVEMKINGRSTGSVRINNMGGELSPAQVNELLAALTNDSLIKFSDGHTIWTLSTHGAAAMLLKMDEFQGRIGTPGALLRKGNKPEEEVLPPLHMPVVLAAPGPESTENEASLAAINRPLLLTELRKNKDCEEIAEEKNEDIELLGAQLSKDKLLVSAECWREDARAGDGYWVINRRPPYAPVLVTTGGEERYKNGEITTFNSSSSHNCLGKDVWTWDGQQFIHTGLSEACAVDFPGAPGNAFVAMPVAPLHAAEPLGVYFSHVDWEMACDNTRTCRAAGYQSEGDEGLPVKVELVRKAGPHQAVTAELELIPKDDKPTSESVRAVEIKINGRSSGSVRINDMANKLSPAQVNELLAALTKDSVITFSDGRTIWTLSTHGAAAVLLKMDEFQGRIGTPGALLRKGNKPEDKVLPPLPMPVVLAAPVPKIKEGVNPLAAIHLPLLLAELNKGNECEEITEENSEDKGLEGFELSKVKLLVTARCTVPAYNTANAFWVINRKPPYAPVLVTGAGEGYGDGEISSFLKLSSSGDCVSEDAWTWDGQQFIHTSSMDSDLCRGFNGGGRIKYVTNVRKAGVK